MSDLPSCPMEQRHLDEDCDTLSIVRDHVRILQLRLHEASAKAKTDDAIDAIADLSNQIHDLTEDFEVAMSRLVVKANAADALLENQHIRSIRHAAE